MKRLKDIKAARVISCLVGFIFAGVSFIFPIGYLFISYHHMSGSLETEAEINAAIVTQVINANPDFWEFEHVRLAELLSRRPKAGYAEIRRIVNMKNMVIAESVDKLKPPVITRLHDLMDSGLIIGKIGISRSLRPLLLQTGLITLLMLPFGFGAYMIIHRLPVQAIYRAEEALKKANETLEARVGERTNELSKINEELRKEIAERKNMEKEINERVKDLEKFYEMAVGRELKMKEQKEKIVKLETELSKHKKDA